MDKSLKALSSEICVCGRKKYPRMSFCGTCYRSLSGKNQKELYRRSGEGYEEAYGEAEKILRENKKALLKSD